MVKLLTGGPWVSSFSKCWQGKILPPWVCAIFPGLHTYILPISSYPPFYDDNSFGIYEKILAGKVMFPAHFDPYAKDLLKRLLVGDRSRRLGNLKGGPDDVKRHKWFRGVDWFGLLEKKVQVCAHRAAS